MSKSRMGINFHQEKKSLEIAIRHFSKKNDKDDQQLTQLMNRLNLLKQHFPQQPRPFILTGMLYERTNQPEKAIKAYDAARRQFANCPHAYIYPAQMYYDAGNYKASKKLINAFNAKFTNSSGAKDKHWSEMSRLAMQVELKSVKAESDSIANTKQIQAIFKNNPYCLLEHEEVDFKSARQENVKTIDRAEHPKNKIEQQAPISYSQSLYNLFNKARAYIASVGETVRPSSNYKM